MHFGLRRPAGEAILRGMPPRPCVMNATCPSRVVLARIGDKWTALIIRSLAGGTLRYNELQRAVAGISQKMLTQTLRKPRATG